MTVLCEIASITKGQSPRKKAIKDNAALASIITGEAITALGYLVLGNDEAGPVPKSYLKTYKVKKYDVLVSNNSQNVKVGVYNSSSQSVAMGSVYIIRPHKRLGLKAKKQWAALVCVSITRASKLLKAATTRIGNSWYLHKHALEEITLVDETKSFEIFKHEQLLYKKILLLRERL